MRALRYIVLSNSPPC